MTRMQHNKARRKIKIKAGLDASVTTAVQIGQAIARLDDRKLSPEEQAEVAAWKARALKHNRNRRNSFMRALSED